MVKKHTSFVNRIRILEHILENSQPVKWRRKIIGYGLRGVDFGQTKQEKKKFPSRDIFNDHVDELWMNKHISRLKFSDKRQFYYSITPLGICYLVWGNSKLPTNTSKIIRILLSFYSQKKFKSRFLPKVELGSDFLNILKNKKLNNNNIFYHSIQNSINYSGLYYEIPLRRMQQKNILTISLNVSDNLKLKLSEVEILPYKHVVLNEDDHDVDKLFKSNLSIDEFHSYLSLFILILFFYNIYNVHNYTELIMNLAELRKNFTKNPMFKILSSLLVHVDEQMKIITKQLIPKSDELNLMDLDWKLLLR